MSTPKNDDGPKTEEVKSEPTYYWCTFNDEAKTKVVSLISMAYDEPPRAELLPDTDSRVQDILNPPEGRYVQRIKINSLEDLNRIASQFENGIPKPLYRGQSNYSWKLQTRLERNIPDFVLSETGLETYEYRVFNESQRRLHQFIDKLPDEDDRLSWLALLRHHSVPTRLLDVTRSLFIACHFALRDAKPGEDAAVWIFSRQEIDSAFKNWSNKADQTSVRTSPFTVSQYGDPYYWPLPKNSQLQATTPTIESLRHKELPWLDYTAVLNAALRGYIEQPGLAASEPFWISRRMDVQQGAFLIPFNVRMSFEENLSSFLRFSMKEIEETTLPEDLFELWANYRVIKLRLPSHLHPSLRIRLDSMNIRDLTLFPDTEGALAHITSLIPVKGR